MPKTIDEKLAQGRQYRGFDVSRENLRTLDDGAQVVEGYATVFNTPYVMYSDGEYTVREQIAPEAFDDCDMSDVIMQYDHMGHVYARTSNGTLEVMPDDVGLKMRGYLGGTAIGRELFEEIDGGYTTKMSFGFIVGERRREVTEDRENGKTDVLVTISKITKLFDVSAVSLPANDATSINARNLYAGVAEEVRQEVLARKKKLLKLQLMLED